MMDLFLCKCWCLSDQAKAEAWKRLGHHRGSSRTQCLVSEGPLPTHEGHVPYRSEHVTEEFVVA